MLAYISFDTVPAPKGASTHIEAFVRGLALRFGRIDLVTPTSAVAVVPAHERWPGVWHTELPACGGSLIERVLCFRRFLRHWLDANPCEVVQFRSIFEGFPLLDLARRPKLIYEVNGVPSVELKYRYPRAADDRELMRKLVSQERACADRADRIVTPSGVTARFVGRPEKTVVIPNGVHLEEFEPAEGRPEEVRLVYFGTLAAWQGVELAVRALGLVNAAVPARLVVLGSGSGHQKESIVRLAAKLGLAERVDLVGAVPRPEVPGYLRDAFAVLAPLPVNDRNTRQGCCPLKVLEGMAAGVPVIASDLPVVRDLGEHDRHLLLVKPGSVDQVAYAVMRLVGDRELWERIGRGGRAHVAANFTWQRAGDALAQVWRELGAGTIEARVASIAE